MAEHGFYIVVLIITMLLQKLQRILKTQNVDNKIKLLLINLNKQYCTMIEQTKLIYHLYLMILQKEYYLQVQIERLNINQKLIQQFTTIILIQMKLVQANHGKMNMLVKFGGTCQLRDILIMNLMIMHIVEHTGVDYFLEQV